MSKSWQHEYPPYFMPPPPYYPPPYGGPNNDDDPVDRIEKDMQRLERLKNYLKANEKPKEEKKEDKKGLSRNEVGLLMLLTSPITGLAMSVVFIGFFRVVGIIGKGLIGN